MSRGVSWRALAAAGLALGLAWLTAPGVPLYDGVGFPDEPYRYVQRPPGVKPTQPPTPAIGQVTAGKGVSNDFFDAPSDEKGPQVEVYSSAGALTGAPDVRSFAVRADPIAPGPAASWLTIDGNVYRLRLTSTPPGPVGLAPVTDQVWAWIALRATSSKPHHPTFVYRTTATGPWRVLHTEQTGNDIFAANVVGSGDYALAYIKQATAKPASSGGVPLTVIALIVTLGLIALAIVGIRIARSRS